MARTAPAFLAALSSRGLWHHAPHLTLLDEYVRDLVFRRRRRLIVEMPPRSGKSQYLSANLPAWYLGTFPDHRVMLGSYEGDFARSWGRKARDILEEWGPRIWGVSVSRSSSAADRWDLAGRAGGMNTAGVGGGFTGRGADLAILDDPIKDAAQARSATYRDALWDWWQSVFRPRFEPDAVAIITMTRWHRDDLAGRLLRAEQEEGAEHWDVLKLPALATVDEDWGFWSREPGDPLWPERYDRAANEVLKASMTNYWWSALYQQEPEPESGRYFDRTWFDVVDFAPPGITPWVRAIDLASTKKRAHNRPDFTAAGLIGQLDGRWYVGDMQRFQLDPGELEDELTRMVADDVARFGRYGVHFRVELEPGASARLLMQTWERTIFKGLTFDYAPAVGPKEERAAPFQSAASHHLVRIVHGSWNREYLDELETFPGGMNDDQVDVSSAGFAYLTDEPENEYTGQPTGAQRRVAGAAWVRAARPYQE